MPTRFYFPVTGVSQKAQPAFDSSWSSNAKFNTSGAFRQRMVTIKGTDAITIGRTVNTAATAGAAGLERQLISDALWGDQTINGTVSGQLMTREFATTDNCDMIIPVLRVVNNNGTVVRGTLLGSGNYGGVLEFVNNATCQNKRIFTGQSITTVNALDGDRIVLEIGCGNTTAGTTPQYACKWGTNAPDLPSNDQSQTTNGAGWFQLNNVNLRFKKSANCEINDEGCI